MKTTKLKLVLFFIAAVLIVACNDDELPNPNPNPGENEVDIETGPSGELVSVTMGTSGKWYAETDHSWVQLSRLAGVGTQNVEVNTTLNRTATERTAKIYVYENSPAKSAGMKSEKTPVQTFTLFQEAASDTTAIAAHFTDVKVENGNLYFRLWTGAGGTVYDIDHSAVSYYSLNTNFLDQTLARKPNTETDWVKFAKVNLANIHNDGKIKIGEQATINSIKIMQGHTLSVLGESTSEASADIRFALDGKIYYGGGFSSAEWQSSGLSGSTTSQVPDYNFYSMNPQTHESQSLNKLPFSTGKATIYKGAAYVLAKNNDRNYTLYLYNAASDSWKNVSRITTEERVLAFYSVNDLFYLNRQPKTLCLYLDRQRGGTERNDYPWYGFLNPFRFRLI